MIRVFENRAGFALPTILIASMVMLIVLITAVSATSSVRSGLDGQYYTQLAREAAESGLARANGCLQDSGYVSTWDGSTLYPNTSCSGGTACSNTASCFVMSRPTIRTTFSVAQPENLTVSQLIRSVGKVELLRSSNGEVWRTYTFISSGRIGKDLSFSTVAFGYSGGVGGYFATIAADGKIQATGLNSYGQLGNGTTSSTLTPTKFKLNGDDKASAIFTNFLSNGINMFVLTDKGTIYGAGSNDRGQLGDGTFTTPRSTPVKFGLPAGVKAKYVDISGSQTYVLGDDNKLYSSGACNNGLLGSNYTISGCTNKSTYQQVALPPVDTSNLNTIPTTNIVTDYLSTFVLMQGGKVYGWGNNGHSQYGNSTTVDTSTPIQMGTFGNAGQPKATQIQTDGIALWVVDDQGSAWSAGYNYYGQLGGAGAPMAVDSLGKCVDNKGSDGVNLQFYTCNDTSAQDWIWRTDGTIYNAAANRCINVLADNATVNLATCNTTTAQKFNFRDDRTVINSQSGKCFNNKSNDGVTIIVYTCSASTNEYMSLPDNDKFQQIPIPASSGNVIKISSDQWSASLLTDTGDVWCFGANASGQCGNGTTDDFEPAPTKFILPGGVTGKDIISTAYGSPGGNYYSTFVVGSDGKVYGAGANYFGQLGDGSTTARSTPVAMLGIDGVSVRAKQVLSGDGTTVIITEDKKVYTVGNNANGELGDGTTTNSSTPHANRYTNVLPLTSF